MTTDKLLTTMVKQGYIEKVKDMVTGEPRFDYHLGPRGKVEVGPKGALELVKKVTSFVNHFEPRYLETI
jgi:hypothetical protein